MSHCGPCTTYFSAFTSLLRICTPLLPPLPRRRTWNFSSKSPYFFLLHRKVLPLIPFGSVEPTRAPSLTDHSFSLPSQPDRSLPVKNPPGSPARAPAARASETPTRIAVLRMNRL